MSIVPVNRARKKLRLLPIARQEPLSAVKLAGSAPAITPLAERVSFEWGCVNE